MTSQSFLIIFQSYFFAYFSDSSINVSSSEVMIKVDNLFELHSNRLQRNLFKISK